VRCYMWGRLPGHDGQVWRLPEELAELHGKEVVDIVAGPACAPPSCSHPGPWTLPFGPECAISIPRTLPMPSYDSPHPIQQTLLIPSNDLWPRASSELSPPAYPFLREVPCRSAVVPQPRHISEPPPRP